MRKPVVAIAIAVVGVLVAVAASPLGFDVAARAWAAVFGDDGADGVAIEGADVGGSGPGSLISATTMPGFPSGSDFTALRAARVVYRSTNGDTGAETRVSGAVFTPDGTPPAGGWPVVALAHGTTGINEDCNPSGSVDLWSLDEPVIGYVKSGYAVALADYEGLGEEGVHPYLDAKTAGFNVIDSVRALRNTFDDVSTRWFAFGGSQGGAAAWAANEQAAPYAPELDLVGAVANSPTANVSGLVAKAQQGTLTEDQMRVFIAIVETAARKDSAVDRDDFRRGPGALYWVQLLGCDPRTAQNRAAATKRLTAGDFTPRTPEAADRIRALLTRWSLPQRALSAPLSVTFGAADTFIDAQWTNDAIGEQCALGGVVRWYIQEGKGHGDVDIAPQFAWMNDRFAGVPVVDQCRPAT